MICCFNISKQNNGKKKQLEKHFLYYSILCKYSFYKGVLVGFSNCVVKIICAVLGGRSSKAKNSEIWSLDEKLEYSSIKADLEQQVDDLY